MRRPSRQLLRISCQVSEALAASVKGNWLLSLTHSATYITSTKMPYLQPGSEALA